MSSVRLDTPSLEKFGSILSAYSKTKPSKAGEERLLKFLQIFAVFNGAMNNEKNDDGKITLENDFLKEITNLAYTEYHSTWTKSSTGLSASVLKFAGEHLGLVRQMEKVAHSAVAYAGSAHFGMMPERDETFFARVKDTVDSKLQTKAKELRSFANMSMWKGKVMKVAEESTEASIKYGLAEQKTSLKKQGF